MTHMFHIVDTELDLEYWLLLKLNKGRIHIQLNLTEIGHIKFLLSWGWTRWNSEMLVFIMFLILCSFIIEKYCVYISCFFFIYCYVGHDGMSELIKEKLLNMRVKIIPIVIWNDPQEFEKRDWSNWKSVGEARPSRLRHCWDWLEYWEESWKPEETCCHSESSERLLAHAGVKNP